MSRIIMMHTIYTFSDVQCNKIIVYNPKINEGDEAASLLQAVLIHIPCRSLSYWMLFWIYIYMIDIQAVQGYTRIQ